MAGLEGEVRKTTDALDAVGNTTKAVTKGYAIGSAGLGALVLFAAYTEDINYFVANSDSYPAFKGIELPTFSLTDPWVVVGLFIGGLLPFLFGGMAMTAVGRAAGAVVEEVRRQFKAMPGIMPADAKAGLRSRGRHADARCDPRDDHPLDAAGTVADCAVPAGPCIAGPTSALNALGAMLLGVIVTGLFVAISMTQAAARGTTPRSTSRTAITAARVPSAQGCRDGDTVGDPYKDTAGPAVNPMIKITNIVALLLLAVLAQG
jgi:K(+)-stimulated pyrophosphate-energized sodium pump